MIWRAAAAAFSLSIHMNPLLRARLFLLISCLLLAGRVAAAPPQVHLATEKEFVGVWKSIPVPISQQPAESQTHPFLQGACNYVVQGADNTWAVVVIESYPGNEQKVLSCNLTAKEVTAQVALLPDNLRFRWERKDALFRMTNPAGTGFVWSVQMADGDGNIAVDAQSPGVDLKRGDLIMQMADRSLSKVLWRMVLRRVTR